AAYARHHGGHTGTVPPDPTARGPLARHHQWIVERMYRSPALVLVCSDLVERHSRIGHQDHFSAITPRGVDVVARRFLGHEDHRRKPELARNVGSILREVPAAHRDAPAHTLGPRAT